MFATEKFIHLYFNFWWQIIFLSPFNLYERRKLMNNNQYTFTYENEPTDKNIYYMFQRLILPTIISTQYKPYEKYWEDYKQLLSLFTKWISIYYNDNNLSLIKVDDINIADSLITDLKFNCLEIDTQYIEEVDIWYNEFLELWEKSCLIKGEKK